MNQGSSLTSALPPQHVVDEPLPLLLTNDRFANHSGRFEHLVRRLEDALQVGRISLRQGQLLAQAVK